MLCVVCCVVLCVVCCVLVVLVVLVVSRVPKTGAQLRDDPEERVNSGTTGGARKMTQNASTQHRHMESS